MRSIVLGSISLSQLGFVCAGIIFFAENMYSFLEAVLKGSSPLSIKALIRAPTHRPHPPSLHPQHRQTRRCSRRRRAGQQVFHPGGDQRESLRGRTRTSGCLWPVPRAAQRGRTHNHSRWRHVYARPERQALQRNFNGKHLLHTRWNLAHAWIHALHGSHHHQHGYHDPRHRQRSGICSERRQQRDIYILNPNAIGNFSACCRNLRRGSTGEAARQ